MADKHKLPLRERIADWIIRSCGWFRVDAERYESPDGCHTVDLDELMEWVKRTQWVELFSFSPLTIKVGTPEMDVEVRGGAVQVLENNQ